MEDGSCHQVERDSFTEIEGFDSKLIHKKSDHYSNLNGGGEKPINSLNSALPNHNNIGTTQKTSHTDPEIIPKLSLKIRKSSTTNELVSDCNVAPKIPKPLITQHSSFRRVLKRPYNEIEIRHRENGDHKDYNKHVLPLKIPIIPPSLQAAAQRAKYLHKRRRFIRPQQNEYAQYLGLQPAVKFKCSKCCCSSFESLGKLKEHQRFCLPHVPLSDLSPLVAANTTPPPASPAGSANTNFRITRKVYLCSACGTYYENWNLFLHIREVHNRHTCLFCFGMFSQAQKLASHLVVKHNIQEDHFASKEDLSSKFSDSFYLLCCKCEKVFTERENFVLHECSQVIKQCSVCKVKGSHTPECPKNSKHKRPSVQSGDYKKGKKAPSVEKKPSLPIEAISDINTSAESASPEKSLPESVPLQDDVDRPLAPQLDCPLASSLEINTDVSNVSSHSSPICKASPLVNHKVNVDESATKLPSEILKNNNNKEDNLKSPVSELDRIDYTANEISLTKNEHVPIGLCLDTEKGFKASPPPSQHSSISQFNSFPLKSFPSNEDQLSFPTFMYKTIANMPQTGNEMAKSTLKPPPRNRRPPKRYQFKNLQEAVPKYEQPEVKEIVNRVPKLTVKVPKMLTEKESTSDYSSESEDSDKLTVDFDINSDNGNGNQVKEEAECADEVKDFPLTFLPDAVPEDIKKVDTSAELEMAVAGEDVALTELTLDRPLDRYPLKDLLRVFLTSTVYNCIYCNHARKVAVNAKQLGLHFIAQHRFTATVDSITAEELMPETIILKIRSCLEEVQNIFLNLEGYDTDEKIDMKLYDQVLECFQCFFVTTVHKDLYMHNRKMHQKTILLCIMCKSNFYSYSELLCHLCPGTYVLNSEIQFRCCLCEHDSIPSAFRLMVHLRKQHHACDVCLETCQNQSKLSNHVWKHKLHHLCYRCGIAYRNKPDITKHLFWKHGTESVLCKKCLQKRWPHVYHFCIPPNSFVCEECNLSFTKAVSLKVHKRLHTNDLPYSCSQENCSDKFISKKLLVKHEIKHLEVPVMVEEPPKQTITTDDKLENIMSPAHSSKEMDSAVNNVESKTMPLKNKKSKKNKKNKEKDNLLIDVNLPALNLSESDSSDESESEVTKKAELVALAHASENMSTDPYAITGNTQHMTSSDAENIISNDVQITSKKDNIPEETKPELPVAGIWDNFKMYQAEFEKQTEKTQTPKPRHVCDSDHDYCVIPINEEDVIREEVNLNTSDGNIKEFKKKQKKRKNSKKTSNSSSSDSSSDSDSSCSCGSNCSCSSSSGSSSSSSSSSDSESSSTQRLSHPRVRKDSDASAVDIMATEESPPRFVAPEPQEVPIAESDLDTDETETDEDFYDEHPQRLANRILAEKRNQLMLLATVAPVNNGTYLDSSRPATPENIEKVKEVKKKVKTKKKKKTKKAEIIKPLPITPLPVAKLNIRQEEIPTPISLPNKITISLQTNTVIDKSPLILQPPLPSSTSSRRDADNKRASKRRRVPNKFYGYSSDEEYAHQQMINKSHLPPKLEWRKEDLPSPSTAQVIQQVIIPEIPREVFSEVLARESRPVISPKHVFKEPIYTSSEEDSDSSREGVLQINHPIAEQMEPEPEPEPPTVSRPVVGQFPFPRPAGVRAAREGESVYCYCRCPYDEVSEMIACDADGCLIEWFHFECVGIMVPPKGKWYCPDCRQRLENEEL